MGESEETGGSLEYEMQRLTKLQRDAHFSLDTFDVPRAWRDGDEHLSLGARIQILGGRLEGRQVTQQDASKQSIRKWEQLYGVNRELLGALKDCVEYLTETLQPSYALKRAKAAIAKAETLYPRG